MSGALIKPGRGKRKLRKLAFTEALMIAHRYEKLKRERRVKKPNLRAKGTLCARIPITDCPIARDADRKIEAARLDQIPNRIAAAEARRARRGIEQTFRPKVNPITMRRPKSLAYEAKFSRFIRKESKPWANKAEMKAHKWARQLLRTV